MPAAGTPAPDFTLDNQAGQRVRLAHFKGKTVLLFAYPKAGTSGCSVQAQGFRDNLAQITAAGGVVLGLSPDPVPVLEKWHDEQGFGYDLLSDPDHAVLEKLGAWGEKTLYGKTTVGVIRSHWVIGPDGVVRDEQLNVTPAQSVALGTEWVVQGG